MDLKEVTSHNLVRHPWETARLKAVQKILSPHLFEGMRILDEGCGDGYIASNLFSSLSKKSITAVDSNLTAEEIQRFSRLSPDIAYLTAEPAGFHDLILLLDVLEHIEDDVAFLNSLVRNSLASGGKILITVPAFQSLFSRHDEFLGHHRRYSLKQLESVAVQSGLTVLGSGYLFCSLLLPRLISATFRRREYGGVGNWRSGRFVTSFVEGVLDLDNVALLAASRLGVTIPGLSGWLLCRKKEVLSAAL